MAKSASKLRRLELDDLFRLRAVGRLALSPDARRVVFELKRSDPKENRNFIQLMVVDADGSNLRELTRGLHNDMLPRWSPDGERLGFLSDRDKGACLFVLRMDGGDAERLTEPDGFVHDFAWSPDSRRIAYAYQPMNDRQRMERDGKTDELKKQPQYKHITRMFHKLDGAGWWNGQYTHIWIAPVEPRHGAKPKQLTTGDTDDREPQFSPDGKLVSFVSNRIENPDLFVENADIFVVKASGGAIKKLTQMPGPCAGHAWSPNGKQIAFIGSHCKRGESWKHLDRVWILPSGGGPARQLCTGLDNHCRNLTISDIAGAGFQVDPVLWSPDATRVYFLVSERGSCRLYSHSTSGNDFYCEVGGDMNVYRFQRTAADGPVALSIGTTLSPGDVFLTEQLGRQLGGEKSFGWAPMNRGKQDVPRQLTHVNGEVLDGLSLAAPEEIWVESGKTRVQAWVFKPPAFDPRNKYPAILEIHGGPATQVGNSFFHEKNWLAAQGYVVVSGNPRGSVGYGLKHQSAIHTRWGTVDYDDVMRLGDWLFTRPFVDKKRVGVTGGSYGGFMTNWIVGQSNRFRAAVTQRSVANMESMFGTSDYGFDLGNEFGGLPWENRELYRRHSPLTFVKNIRTPLLIEHEEEDYRCPIEQAEQLFSSLKVLGRTVEMIRFEGESHGLCRIGRPQNRAERLRRINDWFARHMK